MKTKYLIGILLIFKIFTVKAQEQDDIKYLKIIVDAGDLIETYTNVSTSFVGKAYSTDGEKISKYEWDFNGDGIFDYSSASNSAQYTYKTTGEYRVKLQVTNSNNISNFDIVKVRVVSGSGLQSNLLRESVQLSALKSAKVADGVKNNYAVMINGGTEQRFWNDIDSIYKTLKNIYNFSDSRIYLLNCNGFNPSGLNPNNMIDYAATLDNVRSVFNSLASIMDEDDQLFVWIDDHGSGYAGVNYYDPQEYGTIYTRASVEPGDEQDYLESNFKLRALYTGGNYKTRHGMNVWRPYYQYDATLKKYRYHRNKFVSSYTITLENGTSVSDNDVYIERFVDYLKGDTNKDGIIDSGEKTDYDGDGIPPYNNSTGVFDEDDWGRVDVIEDNYNVLYSQVPSSSGQSYILFDKNLDNKLDIDINPVCSIGNCTSNQLVADGTDSNNDGLFDGIDANQDGDFSDWISIDELVGLSGDRLYDDELKIMLDGMPCKNMIIFIEPCFSGGFIDDLSKKGRVIMTATIEEDVSWGNIFVGNFRNAVHNKTVADVNKDNQVSMVEAFNYAASNDNSEHPQYDDNGDLVSHVQPIPSNSDGCLGSTLSLTSVLLNDILLQNVTISSNATYQGKNITIDNVVIQNNANVYFNASGDVNIVKDFEVKLGSTFEINNSQCP